MNALQIFFGEWWPPFLGISVVFVGMWVAGRFASDGYFLFTSPNSFKELAAHPEDEKKRLLHEASREAFRCWRSVLPAVAFALVVSVGIALGRTISKVTAIPDSWWFHAVFAALFVGAGGWIVMRLAVNFLRPFLRKSIERTGEVA